MSKDLHAGLIRFDSKMAPTAYIAKSWEISPDGLTYTFKLRDDVKFHNGRKVTAGDFVFTFTRQLDPKFKGAVGPQNLSKVKGAKEMQDGKATAVEGFSAPDDATFKITLTQPDPALLLRLATPFMSVIPKEAVSATEAKWTGNPVGAGAFKFVEWQPNVKVVLEAFDGYFLGRPKIDRIENMVVPDNPSALNQYIAGTLDIIDVAAAMVPQINQDANLKKDFVEYPRAQLTFFTLDQTRVAAFKDKRVRQAFTYALNRAELIDKVDRNVALLANGYIVKGIPGFDESQKVYPFDPAKAKQLMAEAGFPDGKGFPAIEVVATASSSSQLEVIAAQLKENIGVNATVRIGERGDVVAGMWAHKWDVLSWGWTADRPSAEVWLDELMYSKAGSNFAGYNNPQFDAAVEKARAEVDAAKAAALWHEAEKIAYDELPYIPYGFAKYLWLVKPNVKGFVSDLLGPIRLETVEVTK